MHLTDLVVTNGTLLASPLCFGQVTVKSSSIHSIWRLEAFSLCVQMAEWDCSRTLLQLDAAEYIPGRSAHDTWGHLYVVVVVVVVVLVVVVVVLVVVVVVEVVVVVVVTVVLVVVVEVVLVVVVLQ